MYQATYENAYRGGNTAFPATRVGDQARSLLRTLRSWRQRSSQRRALSQLDGRLLEDAGITPQQMYEETTKPFWRA